MLLGGEMKPENLRANLEKVPKLYNHNPCCWITEQWGEKNVEFVRCYSHVLGNPRVPVSEVTLTPCVSLLILHCDV